ncbi:MAG: hypothetical protein CME62_00745 [Halobacteriovoraceae bacterium]|nr:hypothetical protein [Halobacteriovoraceae bacterium]|tara:strand:- start:9816 stop:10988 length:1173 start_codon:yes stop_codon:yes gene_type:complete
MKKISFFALSFCLIVGAGFFLLEDEGERSIASQSERLVLLEQIPLVKGYEYRLKNEEKMAYKLANIFKKIADEAANADGSLNRATHAKGQCFRGKTQVVFNQNLSESLKKKLYQGVFSSEREFETMVRFANAKGEVNKDNVGDVRGMSFSIDTNGLIVDPMGSSRLDFMLNTSPMFAVRNAKEFYELMKAARLAQGDLSYIVNPLYFKTIYNASQLLKEFERDDTKSYATERYWSNLPYVHGLNSKRAPQEIVKFSASPCLGVQRLKTSNTKLDGNYLQKDIISRAADKGVCFNLQAQLYDKQKLVKSYGKKLSKWSDKNWIENGGMDWPEKDLPFHTIGKIVIPSGSAPEDCDQVYFNTRLHSAPEHLPLGSLARIRVIVEEISRSRRQ